MERVRPALFVMLEKQILEANSKQENIVDAKTKEVVYIKKLTIHHQEDQRMKALLAESRI